MIAQARYIVVYKDSVESRNLYFGPLTSERTAQEFMDSLPEPLLGGSKTYKPIQPYTHNEPDLAAGLIILQRKRDGVKEDVRRIAQHIRAH